MEENINDRKKSEPSIPANYVSILQLQQQWLNEKERRQKERQKQEEEEEQRRKQQQEEEQRRRSEDDRGKAKAEKQLKEVGGAMERRKVGNKRGDREYWRARDRRGNENRVTGVAGKSDITAISGEKGEENVPEDEILREVRKTKKKLGKRKKKQARVKEDVVGGELDSIPVNNEIGRICRPKAENAMAEKDASNREIVATVATAKIEKKVEIMTISGRERKRGTRSSESNARSSWQEQSNYGDDRRNQRHIPRVFPNNATVATAEVEKKFDIMTISGRERRGDTTKSESNARSCRRNQSNCDDDRRNRHPRPQRFPNGQMNAKVAWVKKEQIDGYAGGSRPVSL